MISLCIWKIIYWTKGKVNLYLPHCHHVIVMLPLTPFYNKPQWLSLISNDLRAPPDLRCLWRPNRFLNSPYIRVSVVKSRSPVNLRTCSETQNELVNGKRRLTHQSPNHKYRLSIQLSKTLVFWLNQDINSTAIIISLIFHSWYYSVIFFQPR